MGQILAKFAALHLASRRPLPAEQLLTGRTRSQLQGRDNASYSEQPHNECRHAKFGMWSSFRLCRRTGMGPCPLQPSLDLAKGIPASGVGAETSPRNVGEGLWDGCWHNRVCAPGSVPKRRKLGQGLDQRNAEGPEIGGRGDGAGFEFRRVKGTGSRKRIAELACDVKSI